jgi:hypothetical protein
MSICKLLIAAVLLTLVGCGAGRSVPLSVNNCTIVVENGAAHVEASVLNRSDKPVTSADLRIDLYQNYRFRRASATATFHPVLDPGTSRNVALGVDFADAAAGPAMQCIATRAVYGDGSVDSDSSGS